MRSPSSSPAAAPAAWGRRRRWWSWAAGRSSPGRSPRPRRPGSRRSAWPSRGPPSRRPTCPRGPSPGSRPIPPPALSPRPGPPPPLPPLDVPAWAEPEQPSLPLAGFVAALERAAPRPIVALACDMPFVPPELIARLAGLDAVAAVPRGEAFPARYASAALPALRAGLAREAPLRAVLAQLDPAEVTAAPETLLGVNDPAALGRAEARLR